MTRAGVSIRAQSVDRGGLVWQTTPGRALSNRRSPEPLQQTCEGVGGTGWEGGPGGRSDGTFYPCISARICRGARAEVGWRRVAAAVS